MAINTQDQEWGNLLKIEKLNSEQNIAQKDKHINTLKFGLMVASQREPNMESPEYRDKKINEKYKRINKPTRPTKGELLGKSGEYLKDPETEVDTSKPLQIKGMPPELDPKKLREQQKQQKIRGVAEGGATEGEREAGRRKLKDKTQLPNFLQTILDARPNNPSNLLKILQFLPALTGGGLGQMAGRPDYSGIPNARDLKILEVWNKYGKKDGAYQDPVKLLQNLPRV